MPTSSISTTMSGRLVADDDRPRSGTSSSVEEAQGTATQVGSNELPSMPETNAARGSDLRSEFENMLLLAEKLQETCDRSAFRQQFFSFIGGSVMFITLGGGLYFALQSPDWRLVFLVAPIFLISALLLALIQSGPKRRLERDKRALGAIVNLLRETEAGIAYQGILSTFEMAQFRIRLSRFDLGPDSAVFRRRHVIYNSNDDDMVAISNLTPRRDDPPSLRAERLEQEDIDKRLPEKDAK